MEYANLRSIYSNVQSASEPSLSPQDYLDGIVKSRGYSATKYSTIASAYYNKPTPLQLASYGVYLIDMIRHGNTDAVQEILSLGLSPNACNKHGESIVHDVCRRSDIHMLDVFMKAGCDIQVSDDSGRTLLHDACWAAEPNFPLVEKLLDRDIQLLFMMDSRGHLPLSYTRKVHWSEWLQFLQSKKDVYWPRGDPLCISKVPEVALLQPNSRSIRDPDVTLTLSLTRMVAGGKLEPKEAQFMQNFFEAKKNEPIEHDDDSNSENCSNGSDDDGNIDDDDDDDDDDDVDDDDKSVISSLSNPSTSNADLLCASWNLAEMNEILDSLTNPNRLPLTW
jgi:Ankyrin repeats (many copies)